MSCPPGMSPTAISIHATPMSMAGSPRTALGQSMTTGPLAADHDVERMEVQVQEPVALTDRGRGEEGRGRDRASDDAGRRAHRPCRRIVHGRGDPGRRPSTALDAFHDEVGAVGTDLLDGGYGVAMARRYSMVRASPPSTGPPATGEGRVRGAYSKMSAVPSGREQGARVSHPTTLVPGGNSERDERQRLRRGLANEPVEGHAATGNRSVRDG